MNIYQEIVEALKPAALGAEARRVVFGDIYAAVEIVSAEGKHALGLAYREGEGCRGRKIEGGSDQCYMGRDGSLPVDRGFDLPVNAADLLAPLAEIFEGGVEKERGARETTISLATASALAQLELDEWETGDVLMQLKVDRGERVAVVGAFPFTPKLVEGGAEVSVFDRGFDDFDVDDMNRALNGADVVVVTGSALANGTLPGVLDVIGDAREVVIVGPTTPLVPKAFAATPVTRLMGVIPKDIDGVMEVVASGGGTRAFSKYVEKVGVRVGE